MRRPMNFVFTKPMSGAETAPHPCPSRLQQAEARMLEASTKLQVIKRRVDAAALAAKAEPKRVKTELNNALQEFSVALREHASAKAELQECRE